MQDDPLLPKSFAVPLSPAPVEHVGPRDADVWALGDYAFPSNSGAATLQNASWISLADPDIVLMQPLVPPASVSRQTHNDSPLYLDGDQTFLFALHERKREVEAALEAGKTVFLEMTDFVGSRAFIPDRGGYNRRSYEALWGYQVFPQPVPGWHRATGLKMRLPSGLPTALRRPLADIASLATYEVLLDDDDEEWLALLTTRSDARRAAAVRRIFNGHVVLLPTLARFREGASTDTSQTQIDSRRFVGALRAIHRALRAENTGVEDVPDWASRDPYLTAAVRRGEGAVATLMEQISALQSDLDSMRGELAESGLTRSLLTAGGDRLEIAVRRALRLMGLPSVPYNEDGVNFDLLGIVGDIHFVGEIEGKDARALDNEKAQQLATNYVNYLSSFEEREVPRVKPLLIGNPQRLAEPDVRDKTFTDLCRRIVPRGTSLILAASMFAPVSYLEMHETDVDYAAECRAAILEPDGQIVEFPDPPA